MELAGIVFAVATSIIATIMWSEIEGWAPRLSTWLTNRAASGLPLTHRARLREEWQAYLAELPTTSSKLAASIGFWLVSQRIRTSRGLKAILGLKDLIFINQLLKPYKDDFAAFGATDISFRLVRRECGNRHLVIHARMPERQIELFEAYQSTFEDEEEDDEAIELRLALVGEATDLRQAVRRNTGDGDLRSVRLNPTNVACCTMMIFPPDRDARPIRTLLALRWKARRKLWRQLTRD